LSKSFISNSSLPSSTHDTRHLARLLQQIPHIYPSLIQSLKYNDDLKNAYNQWISILIEKKLYDPSLPETIFQDKSIPIRMYQDSEVCQEAKSLMISLVEAGLLDENGHYIEWSSSHESESETKKKGKNVIITGSSSHFENPIELRLKEDTRIEKWIKKMIQSIKNSWSSERKK